MTNATMMVPSGRGLIVSNRLWLVVVIVIGSLIAGFKLLGLSADYLNYEAQYVSDAITPWRFVWQDNDPIYHSLGKLSATLGFSFSTFVIFLAVATCSIKGVALFHAHCNRLVLLALYASYLFWLHDYVQIRIALALALGLYGFYIDTRLRYVLFGLAALVHMSFAIVMAAYIGIVLGTRRPVWAAVIGAISAVIVVTQNFLQSAVRRVTEYQSLTMQGQFSDINVFSLMPIIMSLSVLLGLFHFKEIPRDQRQELYLSILGIVAFYALSSTPVFAFRTMELFMPFYLVFTARLFDRSHIAKALVLAYIIVGLRVSLFSDDPLAGGNMIV